MLGRKLRTAAIAGVLLSWAAGLEAAYIVFRDGRTMKVRSYRFEAGETAVEFEGGGSMRFDAAVVKYVAPDDDVDRSSATGLASARPGGPSAAGLLAWLQFTDERFVAPIEQSAARHALDPALVAAVIKIESDFRPHAVSPKGAQGLMQIMPSTARELGLLDPFDPVQNIAAGTAYLKTLVDRYSGDLERALAAYNAGASHVDRANGIPAFRETREYVARVLRLARGI